MTNIMLLILTISLSGCRNLFSKNVAKVSFGSSRFYKLQSIIFIAGAGTLILFTEIRTPHSTTLYLSLVYALLLIMAQWCYTMALGKIKISICSTIYSLGFIIPTISGALFWNEAFTFFDFIGLCLVIAAIILSGHAKKTADSTSGDRLHFIGLVAAMLASGGLGLVQKIQQSTSYHHEKDVFVLMSFMIAAGISFICALCSKTNISDKSGNGPAFSILTGVCFGACNLLNTTLAGKLDSSLFFPLQNISVILLSILLSCFFLKEKFTKHSALIFIIGAVSMIFLNL